MAVAYEQRFEGATLDQYDHVMRLMELLDGGPREAPDGLVFHWAAASEDGLVVVDVWESDEQFNRFAESQIVPFSQEAGITSPPRITRYDVHFTLGPRTA